MDGSIRVFLVVGFSALGLAVYFMRQAKALEMLHDWARAHGLVIKSSEVRTFFKGPYFWTSWKGDVVYYFTAEDMHTRRARRGYALPAYGLVLSVRGRDV